MIKRTIAVFVFLLAAGLANATSYTVKAGGGGSFTTIQACATAMVAGDTCTVFAGTYNENVSISSGSSGSQKTMTVNPGDMVFVESFTIGSFVTVNGFQIQNPSAPTAAPCVTINPSSTNWQITNNNWYACASLSMTNGTNNSHGLIKGNTISYMCSTSSSPNVCYAGTVSGDYILIQSNDMSHLSDGFYMAGAHDYFIGNNFHNMQDSDCGTHSSNCHVDFMQADATVPGGLPSTYLTIEGNTIQNMVATGTGDMHGIGLFQAESCNNECQNAIVRFNIDAHIAHGAIVDDNSGDTTTQAWINVKSYNNSFIDVNHNDASTVGSGTNGYTHGSTGWADVNDLYYYPQASMPNFNPYATDSTTVNAGSYGHDLAFCTGTCTLFGHVYGSGAFTADPGNVEADPLFVNYSGGDYHYNSGSPALNAGTNLTTVASGDSGTGTALIVTDAGYFQDGSSISGLQGDCIAVTTVSNHVCITAVNYSTNTLTLASSITRTVGDHVWLYSDSAGVARLTGTAPNMGALGTSGASPSTPATGDTRTVVEPPYPTVCAKVQATKYIVLTNAIDLDPYETHCGSLSGTNGTLYCTGSMDYQPSSTASPTFTFDDTLDNTAITTALGSCTAGQAVELVPGSSGQMELVISPMTLNAQKIIIDPGVVLRGTSNRADYGGTNCGVVTTGSSSCTPLITITGDGAGIYGLGTIDGCGWCVFDGHTTDSFYSGRIQAYCNENGGTAHGWPNCTPNGLGNNSFGPDMLVFSGATNCIVYKVTLKDSGDFASNLSGVNGCTFWGVNIIAPFEVLNTDGWDTDGTTNATFIHGNISVGDNFGVSKAASSPTSNISFLNNQTGAGIGYGVGSNTRNGVSNVLVDTLVGNGNPNADNTAGFLISSNTSTGGTVNQITYRNTCMVGEHDSVRIYTNYGCNTGTNSPLFQSLLFRNNTFLADGSGNSGHFTLQGLSGLPIGVQLDNFVISGTNQGPSQQCGITLDQYTNMFLGPGQVPSSITTNLSAGTSNTTSGSAGTSTSYPCTTSTWQPLIGNFNVQTASLNNTQGPLPISAGPFVLQASLKPATAISEKESPVLTASVQFLDNGSVIGTVALGGDGSFASLSVNPTSGTHVYQARYIGDVNYPAFTFGSVTVSGSTIITPQLSPIFLGAIKPFTFFKTN